MRSAGQLSCLENAPEVAATASEAKQRTDRTRIGPTVSLASEAASTASETLSETTGQNDEKTKTEEAASMAFSQEAGDVALNSEAKHSAQHSPSMAAETMPPA